LNRSSFGSLARHILLVEQKLSIALRISHRVSVMGHGRIVFEDTPAELKTNAKVRKEWLGWRCKGEVLPPMPKPSATLPAIA
jgi:ABC-type multidrug transport system ATPase subunit